MPLVIAYHLIWTAYGWWLPNDPRGSGSVELRKDELNSLGEILPGRQYPQPPRDEVREFHREAKPLLQHERIWFNEAVREIIANAFAEAATRHGYTVWAWAVCSNHSHGVLRTHRDPAEGIWHNLAAEARLALREAKLFSRESSGVVESTLQGVSL